MKRLGLLLVLMVATLVGTKGAEQPRLVVNVVVSKLSWSDIKHIESNLLEGGLLKLLNQGVRYDSAYYDFAPTTPSAVATITTGANPSLHGVVGPCWWNFTTGNRVGAVEDPKSSTYDADNRESRVSNVSLVMPTLGDALREELPQSKSIAIGADASSAIIAGGTSPDQVWWIDSLGARWTTSTKYLAQLPKWVKKYNSEGVWRKSLARPWVLSRNDDRYHNTKTVAAKPRGYVYTKDEEKGKPRSKDLKKVAASYVSNDMVAQFAREVVIYNSLGGDESVDVLTVCFDAPARIAALYGVDSREWEDTIYRLDSALAEMINFINAQCSGKVVWALSSGGGQKRVDPSKGNEFNTEQFVFLLGSYMNANYGKGEWVLGYDNRGVWLNRELVRSKGENLETIQRSLAQFALQYGGVSHVALQSDMVAGGAKSSLMEVVQEGFYPKRSPDLVVVLMPGWVEIKGEDEGCPKTVSSSVYDHDRKALLSVGGCGIAQQRVARKVNVASLAPTLATLMGIDNPVGATDEPLVEVIEH